MRVSTVFLLAAFVSLAPTAGASGWSIAASYPAPAPNARGINLHTPGGYSILCDGSPPRIYKLGEPSEYINLAIPRGAWGLSSWGQDIITVSNYNNSYIYQLTTTGSVISSFQCPKAHPADLSGGGGIYRKYVAIPEENLAVEVTTTGSVVSSFRGPGNRLTAIEAYSSNDGVIGDAATHRVYFIGFGGFPLGAPAGVWADRKTCDNDHEPPYTFVWVVDAATNYIFQLCYSGGENINPASFGRVKGLFK